MGVSAWEGLSNPKIWSDIEGIDDIYNLPDTALHRKVDRFIQDASNNLLRTAIICPPDIYGRTAGIGNRTSFMVPMYVETLLKGNKPFYLGRGENFRAVVHINDIVDLFLLLINEALLGGGKAQWGREVHSIMQPSSIFNCSSCVHRGFILDPRMRLLGKTWPKPSTGSVGVRNGSLPTVRRCRTMPHR